jgi:cysteine desulfurase
VIYLDNSATTRVDDAVVDAMLPWLRERFGNPSSIYGLGRQARVAIEEARTEIAAAMNAHPAELIFTSGGTESNNMVLRSCTDESGLADHVAHGATEHHAIIHPAEAYERRGVRRTAIPVDADGIVDIATITACNDPRTLVSVMHVNNETGAIQPLDKIRAAAPDALLHTDAVQSFGKMPFDTQQLGVDFATISAHKIHGPKGIGGLFIRKGIDFKAHQHGGGQERNRRAGTEAVALIVGFQVAVRRAIAELEQRVRHMRSMTDLLRTLITEQISNVRWNTPVKAAPHIVNISFPDAEHIDGDAILQLLDMEGVAVSNGSACVSGSLQPSHVLLAMGRGSAEARCAVRFSVSKDTSEQEISQAIAICSEVIRKLRV